MEELNNILKKTKDASKIINILSTELKNQAIINIAEALLLNKKEIIEANEIDIKNAKNNGNCKNENKHPAKGLISYFL